MRRFAGRLPAALLVVVLGIVASDVLDLADAGVAVVGALPSGLPRPTLPTPPLKDVLALVPAAAGLFLVSFADEVLTARSFAGRHDQRIRRRLGVARDGRRERGRGRHARACRSAPAGRAPRSTTRWARASQISGVVAAVAVTFVLLFLTAPIADLPKAVLGAVIVNAAIGLVDPAAWRSLWATDRVEWTIALVTAGGVIVVGVLERDPVRGRALDRRRRAPQRPPARRGAGLGRAAGALGRRLGAPVGAGHAGRRRLSARRPPVLRQRRLRQGARARGAARRTVGAALAGAGRRGRLARRLRRARRDRTTSSGGCRSRCTPRA